MYYVLYIHAIHQCINNHYTQLTIIDYGYARMTASKYFSNKDIKLIAPIESSLWFYLHVWIIWDVKGVLTLGKDSGCGNTNTLPLLNDQDFK